MKLTQWIVPGLLLTSLTSPALGQSPDPASIRGRWAGTGSQEGVKQFAGLQFHYTLDLHIQQLLEHEASGTLWIPEVGCRSLITFLHYAEGVFRFVSQPLKNSSKECIPAVFTLKPAGKDKLAYSATYTLPNHTRHQGLQGTLSRLISVEAKEQQEQ
jgi:hypothetical protein